MNSADSRVHENEGPSFPPRNSRAGSQVIVILNEHRHRSLSEIDNARFSRIHAKICFVLGIGFFTQAYDIFVISIMVSMLGYVYGDENGNLGPWQSTILKVATPVGNFVGQLVFGCLLDILGRRRMYGVELVLMGSATFAQALAGSASAVDIINSLILWRFIMGIGCGVQTRGRLMTAVFACQGWGQLAVGLVGLVVVAASGSAIRNASYPATVPIDIIWRLLVGIGCIPTLIAFYFRYTIPETPRFTMDIERNVTRAAREVNEILTGRRAVDLEMFGERIVAAPRASLSDFMNHFSSWKNLKLLIGTAYSWFAFEIPFYTLTLNSSAILTYMNLGKIDGDSSDSVYQSLIRICSGNVVLAIAGFIPGFCASFFLVDSWGRKPIQLMGFSVLTPLFLVMAFAYIPFTATGPGRSAFVALYCVANFFQNFGPNTTTFIIPGEAFPTRYRSTAYGISAACGKFGAIVAQLALGRQLLHTVDDVRLVLQTLSFVMFTGVLSTLLISETKQQTLEDLSNEPQDSYITGIMERGGPLYS